MKNKSLEIDSATLHIMAMLLMLSDHAWSTLFPGIRFLTSIGRLAYPIFAFMLVEGYFHTSDFKKYIKRLLIFALISEIPFDLMISGQWFSPYHQNVLWTCVISLLGIKIIDTIRNKRKIWLTLLSGVAIILVSFILGMILFVDYFGAGILISYTFYYFRGRKWWCYLGQLIVMYWLNVEMLGGYCYIIDLFGHKFEIVEQGLALFALIPIWLYKGKQGYHSKAFRYFCYSFYPVHMLVLVVIGYMMEYYI